MFLKVLCWMSSYEELDVSRGTCLAGFYCKITIKYWNSVFMLQQKDLDVINCTNYLPRYLISATIHFLVLDFRFFVFDLRRLVRKSRNSGIRQLEYPRRNTKTFLGRGRLVPLGGWWDGLINWSRLKAWSPKKGKRTVSKWRSWLLARKML